MVHDPKTAANELISRGINEGRLLTHIEVQKLLYFWHGWMLGIHGRPLHHGVWEAWRYGPVLPEVYFNLNHRRGKPIGSLIPAYTEQFPSEEMSILDVVYGYRSLGIYQLVGVAHSQGGPWDRVWHNKGDSGIIDNSMIQTYFAELLNKNQGLNG